MRRNLGFYILLILLFVSIVTVMFYFNSLNRQGIRSGFESIIGAEGRTIRSLFKAAGAYLVGRGESELYRFLEDLYSNENIIYVGVTAGEEVLFLKSRFEGYFPIQETGKPFREFKSPIGPVFEINSWFKDATGRILKVYVGFNYESIATFEEKSKRNFWMVMAVIILLLILIILFIIYYDKKIHAQHLKYLQEKEDREHFQELSLLTSEIAHEIKNPLNSLYLSFSTLEKKLENNSKDTVFYREAIKGEIKRITEIINSYSTVAKKIRVNKRDIDMHRFWERFSLNREGELKNLGVEMKIDNQIRHLHTDAELLTQILMNLVNNSIEADARRIQIKCENRNRTAVIWVMDDGKPVEKKILEKIFKPYTSTKIKGMGLGLHITYKIVSALDGKIEILSAEAGKKLIKITLNQEATSGRKN